MSSRDEAIERDGSELPRPPPSLRQQLALRVALQSDAEPVLPGAGSDWQEPEWRRVAPGISCKLLATDPDRRVISMLVRLDPGADYPPHRHAGIEELHLLDGQLWIDARLLHPGDYSRAERDTGDKRVWSETGCICVLITSIDDVLG